MSRRSPAHQGFPAAIHQREDLDASVIDIETGIRREQQGFATRQDLRIRMDRLSTREIRHRGGCASTRGNEDHSEAGESISYDVAILAPASTKGAYVTQRDYGAAFYRNLVQLVGGGEPHPAPVRREKRKSNSLG